MSRGHVKEDDQEDLPMVPPRAFLPEGATNYVTQNGMDLLLAERQTLTDERDQLDITDEKERRIQSNFINSKLQLLNARIAMAKIIETDQQPPGEIRFGASFTLKETKQPKLQHYQIVGVDEADISNGKISFISPLARILLNKKVGDTVILKLARKERVFEIISISY